MIVREQVGDAGVTLLRIDHGRVGALDLELCEALAEALRSTDGSSALVLTGTGSSFSAGVDLKRLLAGGAEYVDAFFPALAGLLEASLAVPLPVVAAVNGHAVAGGCLLAMAADRCLLAEGTARFGIPEIRVGVPFPRAGLEIALHRLGTAVARRVVLDAETYLPQEALRLGLVDEVVEPGRLLDRAVEAAERLVTGVPADTFRTTKAALRHEALERVRLLAEEDDTAREVWRRRVTDGWLADYVAALGSGRT